MIERTNYEQSPTDRRRWLVIVSPILLALFMHLSAVVLGRALGVWAWLPLVIGYWVATFALIVWGADHGSVRRWFEPAHGARAWLVLLVAVAVAAGAPLLAPGLRFYAQPSVWIPTVFFVVINPFAEEGYWRGLLLDAARETGWRTSSAVAYSSLMFTVCHAWMGAVAAGARNPMVSAFQFVFGALCALVYLKTGSLRWPVLAHFLVNLFTPTVAILLGLYVPGRM